MTGLMMIRAYHQSRGEGETRRKVVVPDSAHGTNPASVNLLGWETITVPSNEHGHVDLGGIARVLDKTTAAVMFTVPNTLGVFEKEILDVTRMAHEVGAQCYMDGANLNALVGLVRPGDLGFDLMHINPHKTFSPPPGGGGPGAGPVAVAKHLEPFLPTPVVMEQDGMLRLVEDRPQSVGRVHSYNGNFGILVRALCYILLHGPEGLRQIGRTAILNANYLMRRLARSYDLPYPEPCMHEFVLSGRGLRKHGIKTLDVAKRLLDFGVHAPTVYFPLIVEEALMIEPTETETFDRLAHFAACMERIAQEAAENPQLLRDAPHSTPVSRLDEGRAARELILTWRGTHHVRVQTLERREVLVGHERYREPHGVALEQDAHLVDLFDVIRVELGHGEAAVGDRAHDALVLERPERLAHGDAARAELLRKALLAQARARRQRSAEDRLAQR
jgi:glycine dehydrogenase subunit 2